MNLSEREIKQMMKVHHPDMQGGSRDKFDLLQQALDNLKNQK